MKVEKEKEKRQNSRDLDEKTHLEKEEKTPKKDKNWDPAKHSNIKGNS